jgi:pimeloyl-ACP methyl ester carboxylesterase
MSATGDGDGEELVLRIGEHRLHGRRYGSPAAPMVLGLHGLTGSSEQLAALGAELGGDHLQFVALDLRGRARSDWTGPGSYGWAAHADDVLAVAALLDADRFAVVGLSMGGSIAMKVAEVDGARLEAVVLLDVAGRVDPGVGQVVAAVTESQVGADPVAIGEDRRSAMTEDPYARWRFLTMPTLLVRATQELAPGAGFVVPADDRERFRREVVGARVVEVAASHRAIADHPDTAAAVREFLGEFLPRSL